jgi:signal transduction histidine kinase
LNIYSSHIIQNISDAIVVYDKQAYVRIFNHAAELLFQKNEEDVIGKPISYILNNFPFKVFNESDIVLRETKFKIQNQLKNLLISKTVFKDGNSKDNSILVIRDLTEIKRLEEQIYKRDHLSAIGQLASGIAHEILNPLNTISTIIQQLWKDFEPKENRLEYDKLANLVYNEVRRINNTIQGFLNYACTNFIRPQFFRLSSLINLLSKEYQLLLKESELHLTIDQAWDGEVYWDQEKMRHVFMNLIQNAIDVLMPNGEITIGVLEIDEKELEIIIHDNGPGIPEGIRSKIFNLYFTTKPDARGIGLSSAQQIIYEHGGTIFLNQSEDPGTTFILQMPKKTEILERGSL